jgi:hypothetical protein
MISRVYSYPQTTQNPVKTGFQNRVDRYNSQFPSTDPNSICTSGGEDPSNLPQGDPLLVG